MSTWTWIYLGGVSLKLLYNILDWKNGLRASDKFNDTILWPVYLCIDLFMSLAGFFFDNED